MKTQGETRVTSRKIMVMTALACWPVLPAQATDALSSSYFDAAYLNASVDRDSATAKEDTEGFRVAASVGLMPYLNFVIDFDERRYDESHDGFGAVGLAAHTTGANWQFHVAATYERSYFEDDSTADADQDGEGYGGEAGLRVVAPFTELHASYKYFDLGELDPVTEVTGARYGAGIVLNLSSWWSLTGDYRVRKHEFEDTSQPGAASTEDEFTEWTVGLRRYFVTQTDRRQRGPGLLSELFADDDAE